MPRPHIEFIQSTGSAMGKRVVRRRAADVETKILSIDSINAESSALVRYPKGWKQTAPEHLLADEEILVLDGAIEIAGVEYSRHCYAYLPSGYLRPSASSKNGAGGPDNVFRHTGGRGRRGPRRAFSMRRSWSSTKTPCPCRGRICRKISAGRRPTTNSRTTAKMTTRCISMRGCAMRRASSDCGSIR